MDLRTWRSHLQEDQFTEILQALYGPCTDDQIEENRERYRDLIEKFQAFYDVKEDEEISLFSTPGRSEISGNHTDHQQGQVIACSVNLDIIAAARKVEEPVIRVKSFEFEKIDEINIDDLSMQETERESSAAMIRGIASKLNEMDFDLGGCEIYTISRVPKGSGLSSSAAFEVMIVTILDKLFGAGDLPVLERAKIAQYAENHYFGKPSGLMDQSACAVGGLIHLDFEDPADPQLYEIDVDFSDFGYDLIITECPGDHADLTDEYAAIPREMKAVANELGQDHLRPISLDKFMTALPDLHNEVSDRALLRAFHFITENHRVPELVEALEEKDLETFLDGILSSGKSSWMYLQNLYDAKEPAFQSLAVGLMVSEALLKGEGAWRVHGGGFAGTVQAFVPHYLVETYRETMDKLFGEGKCQVLNIRPIGTICLDTL